MSTCIHEMDSVFNRVLRLLTPARILTPSREISVKSYKQWWRLNSLTLVPLTSTTTSQRSSCAILNRSFNFCVSGEVSKLWMPSYLWHILTYSDSDSTMNLSSSLYFRLRTSRISTRLNPVLRFVRYILKNIVQIFVNVVRVCPLFVLQYCWAMHWHVGSCIFVLVTSMLCS